MTVIAYVKLYKGHMRQERSQNMQCRRRRKKDVRKELP